MGLAAHPCSLTEDLGSGVTADVSAASLGTGPGDPSQEGRFPCSLKLVRISQAWASLISPLRKQRQEDL